MYKINQRWKETKNTLHPHTALVASQKYYCANLYNQPSLAQGCLIFTQHPYLHKRTVVEIPR